jgi:hypothetical protein
LVHVCYRKSGKRREVGRGVEEIEYNIGEEYYRRERIEEMGRNE